MTRTIQARMTTLAILFLAVFIALPLAFTSIANAAQGKGTTYYIKNDLKGGTADLVVKIGQVDDQIYVGDWNGTGIDTIAIRRGNEFIVYNSTSGAGAPVRFRLGNATDEVYVGDWNGNGYDTFALRVKGTNLFRLYSDLKGTKHSVIQYGRSADQVVIGDWDGNGIDNITVRRGNRYYITDTNRSGIADKEVDYGKAGDEIYVGDWDGNAKDALTVRRGNTFLVRNTLSSGVAEHQFTYGRVGDAVFIGDWNGTGSDTFMVRRHDNVPATLPRNNQPGGLTAPPSIATNTTISNPIDVGSHAAHIEKIGLGYARNDVNTPSYAKTPIVTSKGPQGHEIQTVGYYDPNGNLVLARKNLTTDSQWERHITQYSGRAEDGHSSISMAIDGDGYLHVAWGMHNWPMQYARSTEPWSLHLGPVEKMTGIRETLVTYPEFYEQSNGNLFAVYRHGRSGDGDMVINHYDTTSRKWTQVHSNLIDGASIGASPYWQVTLDSQDRLHIAWNWRDDHTVESNHDFMYARSTDATGRTWVKSTGEQYQIPITAAQAELITPIPTNSELMNQTSMIVDEADNPYVISYWRPVTGEPVQYMLMYLRDGKWVVENTRLRTTDFTLSGAGSILTVMGRPKIVVTGSGSEAIVHLLVRDVDFYSGAATMLSSRVGSGQWRALQLTDTSLGSWEPIFDTARWREQGKLDLLIVRAGRSYAENMYVLRVSDENLRTY